MAAGTDITARTKLAMPIAFAVPTMPKFCADTAPVYKLGSVRQIPKITTPTDQPETVSFSRTFNRALLSKLSVNLDNGGRFIPKKERTMAYTSLYT